ncbi:MAG: hypothetical protein ACFB0E_19720 [Leptolyngbyaceae cyanobacterium]
MASHISHGQEACGEKFVRPPRLAIESSASKSIARLSLVLSQAVKPSG